MCGKWGFYGLIKEAMVRDGVFMMKSNGYWELIKMGIYTYRDGWVHVVQRRLVSQVNERVKTCKKYSYQIISQFIRLIRIGVDYWNKK